METRNNGATNRLPRPVPYSAKLPERCLHCGGRSVIRKGSRKKKLEIVQLWQCRSCHRVFTPGPQALRNKKFPLKVIIEAITLYNLGYSLGETIKRLKSRFGFRLAPSTVSNWLAEHKNLATYARLRETGRRLFTPHQTIRSVKLYHRQVYSFGYHRAKLETVRDTDPAFSPLADFLEAIPETCPHPLFQEGSRASQLDASFIDESKLMVVEKENVATRTAALIIPTVGDNRLRHESLQRFMLVNDSVTVAVEIPIWLKDEDLRALGRKYRTHFGTLNADNGGAITGHIDFIQVRNGAVHILDYKPDAKTNKPIAQLTLYALAISERTGIPLFDIKCAWFNEEQYCEFFPRKILSRDRFLSPVLQRTPPVCRIARHGS